MQTMIRTGDNLEIASRTKTFPRGREVLFDMAQDERGFLIVHIATGADRDAFVCSGARTSCMIGGAG
jgi:hypothetical protein